MAGGAIEEVEDSAMVTIPVVDWRDSGAEDPGCPTRLLIRAGFRISPGIVNKCVSDGPVSMIVLVWC